MTICTLCLKAPADKSNSHIISHFLTKGLFTNQKILAYKIDREKPQKIQSTPKADNLFCTECESRMNIVETYFGRKLLDLFDYTLYPNDFIHRQYQGTEFIECKKMHAALFKLFFFLQIWRCSVTDMDEFKNFKLSSQTEEIIRNFLDNHLQRTNDDLIKQTFTNIPKFEFFAIKARDNERYPLQNLSAYSDQELLIHLISMDKLFLMIYELEEKIPAAFKRFSMKKNKAVFVGTGDSYYWKSLMASIANKFNYHRADILNDLSTNPEKNSSQSENV